MTRLLRQRRVASVPVAFAIFAGTLLFAHDLSADVVDMPAELQLIMTDLRRVSGCPAGPTDDQGRETVFRGRPSLEVKGRAGAGAAFGVLRDLSVYDLAVERIVSYTCFANASTRKGGEPIVSLAEASSRADRLARDLVPGASLELESIGRYRTSGAESIYYEARYATITGEYPFLEPPVRLLINASTGSFFRVQIDPDWLEPAAPPRARISRRAAELVASVVLRRLDLAPVFGPGAVLGKVGAADLYTVHPNDWLGLFTEPVGVPARVAWVVPFRIDGGEYPGIQSLFVDASTGRILGGQSSLPPGPPPP